MYASTVKALLSEALSSWMKSVGGKVSPAARNFSSNLINVLQIHSIVKFAPVLRGGRAMYRYIPWPCT